MLRPIRHGHRRALQMQRFIHSHALPLIGDNSRQISNGIRNELVTLMQNMHYLDPSVTALSDSITTKNIQRHVQQELSLFHHPKPSCTSDY